MRSPSSPSAIAVISLGNTSVSAGIWRDGRLAAVNRVPTIRLGRGRLLRGVRLAELAVIRVVAVASVVPEREGGLELALRNELGGDVGIRYLGRGLAVPLVMRVRQPKSVGADRLAGAVAAHRRFGAAVVVDFGTAVTVNAVSSGGEFLGGAILPGVSLAVRALSLGTAQVKLRAAPSLMPPPGRSTGEAVAAGVGHGLAGAVDRLAEETLAALGGKAACVATGGGAAAMLPVCRTKFAHIPGLVLEGLAVAAEAHMARGVRKGAK